MNWLVPRTRVRRTASVAGLLVATILAVIGVPVAEDATGTTTGNVLDALGVYAGPDAPGVVSSFGHVLDAQPAYAMDFLDGDSWSALVNGAPSHMAAWAGS